MKAITVYCGSKFGSQEIYKEEATRLAQLIADRNIHLVYGGGDVGLMGVMANTVLDNGGTVTGVIPHFLQAIEGHLALTENIVVDTMHERKTIMVERSDAFIILPGGFGTMDEFMEIVTWAQLKLHYKPVGIYNVNNYYQYFLQHVHHMIDQGFVNPEYRDLIIDDDNLERLLDRMEEATQPHKPVDAVKM
ncbi:MAG: TIGR00730 family Rossman fold protein [Bacteroidota bacterium]